MAWTAPMTAEANVVFTSAQWNTHVRDNLLESAVAKATTAGRWFVTESTNLIKERNIASGTAFGSSTTTTTGSYVDLASADGPAVTSITTGTQALVFFTAELSHGTVNNADVNISYGVTGATTSAASDSRRVFHSVALAGSGNRIGGAFFHTGLTAGVNTFTMKYKFSSAGTMTASRREIVVMAL